MARNVFLGILLALGLPACSTASPPNGHSCDVSAIEDVLANAVRYAGKTFCGEVYALEHMQTARFVRNRREMPPSDDLALLVTSRTRHLLEGLSGTPKRYYVEARIDPQSECFRDSGSGETCLPYRRPIFMHVLTARPAASARGSAAPGT